MKYYGKFFLLVFLVFFNFNLYTQEQTVTYSYIDSWWHDNVKGGDIIVKIEMLKIDTDILEFKLYYKWENLSGVINNQIIANGSNDFYKFTFVDDYGNKAFGHIIFKDKYVDIYFDCSDYSEIGKNFRRLYGNSYKLTKDKI